MNKLTLFIFLLFIFCVNKINAQPAAPVDTAFINSIQNFENYIIKHYKPNKHEINLLCENSCVFIRFKILKGGKIGELAFNKRVFGSFSDTTYNKNTPPIIINALIRAFKSAEAQSVFTEQLQSDERTYLLPFIYYYDEGCYMMRKAESKKTGPVIAGYKSEDEEQQLGSSIISILNYSDQRFSTLRCTILNPIIAGKKER